MNGDREPRQAEPPGLARSAPVPIPAASPEASTVQPGRTGLDRLVAATGYSLAGLLDAVRSEAAFRQELCVAAVLLPLAFWIGRGWVETSVLVGSLFGVLIAELLNSGVEAVVDRVSLDRHALSKKAKDLGSAAVFLSLLLCAGIWLAAVWQRFAA